MQWWSRRRDESRPAFHDVGTRVEEILRLAEEQAEAHRAEARREAAEIMAAARREAEEILAAARREARRITDGT